MAGGLGTGPAELPTLGAVPVGELLWEPDPTPPPRRPIMVVALAGLFDTAGAASAALEHLVRSRPRVVLAEIDPDRFYDFTQARPTVWLDELGERQIAWPANVVHLVRFAGSDHDLVVVNGVEPHLGWGRFTGYLVEVARDLHCEVVITLGASAEAVPHTRTPVVVGSCADERVATRLGLARPQYQGPTGVVGVLQATLEREQIPGISLRVPVPHYLSNAEHPQASAALLRHLEHVLGLPTHHGDLADDVAQWRERHDAAVATDGDAVAYVAMLEREFDRRAEAAIPTADDLGRRFEEFLREQRPPQD